MVNSRRSAWSQALDGAPLTAGILASCALCTLTAWYGPPQAYRALVPSTSDGPWLMAIGLLTSALVHGDLFHIVFNGFWVLDIGTRIERARGMRSVLLFSVVAAMFSGTVQWMSTGRLGIGYSGVVYALVGWAWASPLTRMPQAHLAARRAMPLLFLWGLVCIGFTLNGSMAVANGGHFGGLGIGVAIGACTGASWARRAGVMVLLCAGAVMWVTVARQVGF